MGFALMPTGISGTPTWETSGACACVKGERCSTRFGWIILGQRVGDLPWVGWAVRLELHVRRFFCQNKECPRRVFTERLPSVVAPYARRTTRLCDLLTLIGFAMGGEAGNCLVERMGLEASPETLLRLVRQQEERQVPTPRVLGVDDFCFCRRRSYGAILIDLERRGPIDLLPDREAETFKKWVLAPPRVEVISRGRGGSFAGGANGRCSLPPSAGILAAFLSIF